MFPTYQDIDVLKPDYFSKPTLQLIHFNFCDNDISYSKYNNQRIQ